LREPDFESGASASSAIRALHDSSDLYRLLLAREAYAFQFRTLHGELFSSLEAT